MIFTYEQIKKNNSIPTDEIEQDIADTEKEIEQYKKEIEFLKGRVLIRKKYINHLNLILIRRTKII